MIKAFKHARILSLLSVILLGNTAFAERQPDLQMSFDNGHVLEEIRSNLFADQFIDTLDEIIAIQVSGHTLSVNGQPLPAAQLQKYIQLLNDYGIQTSDTTQATIRITGDSLSVQVGE